MPSANRHESVRELLRLLQSFLNVSGKRHLPCAVASPHLNAVLSYEVERNLRVVEVRGCPSLLVRRDLPVEFRLPPREVRFKFARGDLVYDFWRGLVEDRHDPQMDSPVSVQVLEGQRVLCGHAEAWLALALRADAGNSLDLVLPPQRVECVVADALPALGEVEEFKEQQLLVAPIVEDVVDTTFGGVLLELKAQLNDLADIALGAKESPRGVFGRPAGDEGVMICHIGTFTRP